MVGIFREWSEFNVAVAGAGAAVGGLLILVFWVALVEVLR